ncbi:MAG: carbohydrate-binding domain-containing protein [Chloroflexi bacterium]|nr:carbohydrate-binding domain-containing protein [Chloroflexota bacterium]
MTNRSKLFLLAFLLTLSLLIGCTTASAASTIPVVEQAEPVEDHAGAEDYIWDSAAVTHIVLTGDTANVEGTGAVVDGSTVTIRSAGNYSFSGVLADGQIIVDTEDEALVRLILNGVQISNSTTSPIYVANAEETMIVLADNTSNGVADGTSYVYASPEEDEANAAIFSKSDLTVYGNGTLMVTGSYNDGIASKDGLVIASGAITVSAVDDAIRGKDYVVIEGGTISVNAGGDGVKSDNEEDADRGYIAITDGIVNVTAGGDAIAAQTSVMISGGTFSLVAGGGSGGRLAADASAKGIRRVWFSK